MILLFSSYFNGISVAQFEVIDMLHGWVIKLMNAVISNKGHCS